MFNISEFCSKIINNLILEETVTNSFLSTKFNDFLFFNILVVTTQLIFSFYIQLKHIYMKIFKFMICMLKMISLKTQFKSFSVFSYKVKRTTVKYKF